MPEVSRDQKKVLYHVLCAAPPSQTASHFITLAQSAGWDVCIITTPQATKFVDVPFLEKLTGHPVRSEYKEIGTCDVFPKMQAMVVAPMTLNTTTKWAQGHADTLALSQLCKGLGLKIPIVAAPCITTAYANHPAFPKSLETLESCGIRILYDPIQYPAPNIVPWEWVLDALTTLTYEASMK